VAVPEDGSSDVFRGDWDRHDSRTYMTSLIPDQYSKQSFNL
jgi:hypothetical protein